MTHIRSTKLKSKPYPTSRSLGAKLITYGIHHIKSAITSLGHLLRTGITSILMIGVIGIAVALPLTGYVGIQNMQDVVEHLNEGAQLSLYLDASADDATAEALLTRLSQDERIIATDYISPAAGLAQLETDLGLGDILNTLVSNPLPPVIVLTPANELQPAELAALQTQIQAEPLISQVQLDFAWVERLHALLQLGHRLFILVASILALAVIVIVSTIIRMNIIQYRHTIEVMQLVGATTRFIRRFFLYLGLWYGLAGSLVAWLIVQLCLYWLATPVAELASAYHTTIQLQGLTIQNIVVLCIVSMCLAISGAWFTVGQQIRHITLKQ